MLEVYKLDVSKSDVEVVHTNVFIGILLLS